MTKTEELPVAPTASAAALTVAFESTGTKILTASGDWTSLRLATGPSHGTGTLSGSTLTYTAGAGYVGGDTVTFTATGPGGTSSAATVTITVSAPPPPVANDAALVTAYETATTASLPVTGRVSTVALGAGPAHGSATIAGTAITYTPAPGYIGADSVTYTAAGLGGTSAAATLRITVSPPPAPVALPAHISAAFGAPASTSVTATGLVTSYSLASAPLHGKATLTGSTVSYTPASGFWGQDVLTFTATGPGGLSTPATIAVDVAAPPTALAQALVLEVPYGATASARIPLRPDEQLVLASPSAHGVAAVGGDLVGYSAGYGYSGEDSFQIAATGPGGQGPAFTVTVHVGGAPAPVLAGALVATAVGQPVSYAFRGASQIVGYRIVTPPAHGSARLSGGTVTYTPAPGFEGTDFLQVVADGPVRSSTPATLGITVGRPGYAPAGGGGA